MKAYELMDWQMEWFSYANLFMYYKIILKIKSINKIIKKELAWLIFIKNIQTIRFKNKISYSLWHIKIKKKKLNQQEKVNNIDNNNKNIMLILRLKGIERYTNTKVIISPGKSDT